jgi:hypothetical protein
MFLENAWQGDAWFYPTVVENSRGIGAPPAKGEQNPASVGSCLILVRHVLMVVYE